MSRTDRHRRLHRCALPLLLLLATGCNRREYESWVPVPPAADSSDNRLAYDPQASAILERGRLGEVSSFVMVHGVDGGILALLLAVASALYLEHRRRAKTEESFDPRAPLADGPAVVFGTVETEDGGPAAVVRVYQVGREYQNKGNWSHVWSEIKREVLARPFLLRTPGGGVVRVEPDPSIALHDSLGRIERSARDRRLRISELMPGEQVHASGMLQGVRWGQPGGAFRDGGRQPVLRAPTLGRLVISTEVPGHTARRRARFHRNWGIAFVLLAVLLDLVLVPAYNLLLLDGEQVLATPVATQQSREWVKPKNSSGYWRYHYEFQARGALADGTTVDLQDEGGLLLHQMVTGGQVPRLSFMVATHRPSVHRLGDAPTSGTLAPVLMLVALLVLLIAYPIAAFNTRPWYLQKTVTDRVNGRL